MIPAFLLRFWPVFAGIAAVLALWAGIELYASGKADSAVEADRLEHTVKTLETTKEVKDVDAEILRTDDLNAGLDRLRRVAGFGSFAEGFGDRRGGAEAGGVVGGAPSEVSWSPRPRVQAGEAGDGSDAGDVRNLDGASDSALSQHMRQGEAGLGGSIERLSDAELKERGRRLDEELNRGRIVCVANWDDNTSQQWPIAGVPAAERSDPCMPDEQASFIYRYGMIWFLASFIFGSISTIITWYLWRNLGGRYVTGRRPPEPVGDTCAAVAAREGASPPKATSAVSGRGERPALRGGEQGDSGGVSGAEAEQQRHMVGYKSARWCAAFGGGLLSAGSDLIHSAAHAGGAVAPNGSDAVAQVGSWILLALGVVIGGPTVIDWIQSVFGF